MCLADPVALKALEATGTVFLAEDFESDQWANRFFDHYGLKEGRLALETNAVNVCRGRSSLRCVLNRGKGAAASMSYWFTQAHVIRSPDGRFHLCVEKHKTAKMTSNPVPRTVPLLTEAKAIIERQVAQHPDSEHVFLTDGGTPYAGDVFRRRMERWCHRAGIKQRTPYSMRHTFASRQADSGTNLVSLAQLMGHSTTHTTERYISSTQEHHRQVIDRNAASILALVTDGNGKQEMGEKVARKVDRNSAPENDKGGCVAATASVSTP